MFSSGPSGPRAKPSLVSLARGGAGGRLLFCFHHAGGGAAGFRNWQRLLAPSIQVATVLLPGRESLFGEPPLTDLAAAVERIGAEIAQCADRPYGLFGHSFGAMLAFETARKLECGSGRAPSCLIVSGRRPLNLDSADEDITDAARGAASTLGDEAFLALLRRMGGTPPEVLGNPELMALLLPAIRADFRLAEGYHWQENSRVACPILALGGRDDRFAAAGELTRWAGLTATGAATRLFDGGHFFVRTHETEVCREIAAFVQQATASAPA